MLVIYLTIVL